MKTNTSKKKIISEEVDKLVTNFDNLKQFDWKISEFGIKTMFNQFSGAYREFPHTAYWCKDPRYTNTNGVYHELHLRVLPNRGTYIQLNGSFKSGNIFELNTDNIGQAVDVLKKLTGLSEITIFIGRKQFKF